MPRSSRSRNGNTQLRKEHLTADVQKKLSILRKKNSLSLSLSLSRSLFLELTRSIKRSCNNDVFTHKKHPFLFFHRRCCNNLKGASRGLVWGKGWRTGLRYTPSRSSGPAASSLIEKATTLYVYDSYNDFPKSPPHTHIMSVSSYTTKEKGKVVPTLSPSLFLSNFLTLSHFLIL